MDIDEVRMLLLESADALQDQSDNSLAWKLRQLAHRFVSDDEDGPTSPQIRAWQALQRTDPNDPLLIYQRMKEGGGTITSHWVFTGRDRLGLARTMISELIDYHELDDMRKIADFMDEDADMEDDPEYGGREAPLITDVDGYGEEP